jgi:hypothetical protein
MIRALIGSLAMLVASTAAECQPSPTPPMPDASDAAPPAVDAGTSIYARACANLADQHCQEGLAPNCAAVLEHAQTARINDFDPPCLADAGSKDAVRACGRRGVKCP